MIQELIHKQRKDTVRLALNFGIPWRTRKIQNHKLSFMGFVYYNLI